MTAIHARQLQQYTQDNYNNTHKTATTIHTRQLQQYTQDNYNTHKSTTTIHTRQLQQYTQDNYNNIHKTITTINKRQLQQYTRQLQQYTKDNYNNTHKTTTTIHTRQLQQYTQDNYNTHKTTTTIHTKQLQQYTQDNSIHTRQLQQYTQGNSQCKNRDLLRRKAIFVKAALCCLFHAKAGKSRCGTLHFATAERLRAMWGCEERCRTAWHWEALHKVSHTFVNHSSPHPHPHSKHCISREVVLPCVTQQQVDADMRYVAFIHAWWQRVLKLQIVSATFLLPSFVITENLNKYNIPVHACRRIGLHLTL